MTEEFDCRESEAIGNVYAVLHARRVPQKGQSTFSQTEESVPDGWPLPGDKLFAEVEGPSGPFREMSPSSALVNFSHEIYLDHEYRKGYFNASRVLAERIQSAHRADRQAEGLWAPMIQNLRQYVELALKALIAEVMSIARSIGVDPNIDWEEIAKSHNLAKLWNAWLKARAAAFPGSDFDEATERAMDSLVQELHRWDPRGTIFRYPRATDGRVHAEHDLPVVDPANWLEVTARLHSYLEGSEIELDVSQEQVADYLDSLPGPDG